MPDDTAQDDRDSGDGVPVAVESSPDVSLPNEWASDEPVPRDPTPDAQPTSPPRKKSLIPLALADRLAWSDRQRRGMALILAVVLGVFVWRALRDRALIADPQPVMPVRAADLADRLDPNTAAWQDLVAIPMLGEKRAKAIVEHREDWLKRHPGEPAYQTPFDLAAVKGIGASMIETISPHMIFPTPPASQTGQ